LWRVNLSSWDKRCSAATTYSSFGFQKETAQKSDFTLQLIALPFFFFLFIEPLPVFSKSRITSFLYFHREVIFIYGLSAHLGFLFVHKPTSGT